MKILIFLLLTMGGITTSQAQQAQSTPCLHYEPQVVSLKGRLSSVRKYGPPNFGETPKQDQKIVVPILRLDRAVDVCADTTSEVNAEGARDVKRVQLIFPKGSAKAWYKRRVVVSGTLMLGHTGQHFTKVVMIVQTVKATK